MTQIPRFEELDYQKTPLGELSLRRRTLLSLDNIEVHEVVLGDAFLMSSLFTTVEIALANLGLTAAAESFPSEAILDVVVGGLGLGYTAKAALDHPATCSLIVVDFLEPVIRWHKDGLVPLGAPLCADSRCSLIHGDFFKLALSESDSANFDPDHPGRKFHAVLLDIDHSPSNLLHEQHAAFYQVDGLRKLSEKIHPGGVFALWSDEAPDPAFMKALGEVFPSCESHIVTFHNPHQDKTSASTVYVARTAC